MQSSLRRSFLSWSIHDPYMVLEALCLLTASLFWSVWESISAPLLISSSQPESHPDHRNSGTSPLLLPASQLSNTELLCLPLSSTNLPSLSWALSPWVLPGFSCFFCSNLGISNSSHSRYGLTRTLSFFDHASQPVVIPFPWSLLTRQSRNPYSKTELMLATGR